MKSECLTCYSFNPTQIDPGMSYRCRVAGECPAIDMSKEEIESFWNNLGINSNDHSTVKNHSNELLVDIDDAYDRLSKAREYKNQLELKLKEHIKTNQQLFVPNIINHLGI